MGRKLERPHEFLQSYQSGHLVHWVLFSSSSWERPILNIIIHRSVFWAARVSANQLLLLNGSSCVWDWASQSSMDKHVSLAQTCCQKWMVEKDLPDSMLVITSWASRGVFCSSCNMLGVIMHCMLHSSGPRCAHAQSPLSSSCGLPKHGIEFIEFN